MSGIEKFNLDLPVKVHFGCGVMDDIQKSSLPGRRIMIVTGGKTIRSNGTVDRLVEMIRKKADDIRIYDEVSPNPSLTSVMKGASSARDNKTDCVIGLGGGSSLDTAKGIAAMAVNDGSLWDYTASGSGSGKTRFWLKPNLLQMHSSYVITDPKGTQYGILNEERHV